MKNILVTFIFIISFFTNIFSEESNKNEVEIFKNIRCLVCQGQSIAESNSEFAQTIKLVVRDKIDEGSSNQEIYDFLISKYGEWIVYKPKMSPQNFLLWFFTICCINFWRNYCIYSTKKKRKSLE